MRRPPLGAAAIATRGRAAATATPAHFLFDSVGGFESPPWRKVRPAPLVGGGKAVCFPIGWSHRRMTANDRMLLACCRHFAGRLGVYRRPD